MIRRTYDDQVSIYTVSYHTQDVNIYQRQSQKYHWFIACGRDLILPSTALAAEPLLLEQRDM